MSKKFNNQVLGLVSLTVKNSNLNSSFEGVRIVNNKLISTDKSLKFLFRHFVDSNSEKTGKIVFYKKSLNDKNLPVSIEERAKILNCSKFEDFIKLYDNKLFGATIIGKKTGDDVFGCVHRGSLQVSYGENIYKHNNFTTHTILSQFQEGDNTGNSTVGSEHKVDEANYIHYLSLTPSNLQRDKSLLALGINDVYISDDDVEYMKFAFSNCVGSSVDGSYNSASKSGTKVGLTVFVTIKDDVKESLSLKNLISVTDYDCYDLTKLYEWVNNRNLIKYTNLYI